MPSFHSSGIGKHPWGPAGRGEVPSSLLVASDQSQSHLCSGHLNAKKNLVWCEQDKMEWEWAPLQKEVMKWALM